MSPETVQVGFRLPADLVSRIDEYAERLSKNTPGLTMSRTDAIRVLLTKALDADAEEKPKKR